VPTDAIVVKLTAAISQEGASTVLKEIVGHHRVEHVELEMALRAGETGWRHCCQDVRRRPGSAPRTGVGLKNLAPA